MSFVHTLRTEPHFRKLWYGHALSLIGTTVTDLALPLTAAVYLGASPVQMGVLGAMDGLPWLFGGLVVGALVDRWPKRRVMLTADLLRAAIILVVPLLAWLGGLDFWVLAVVSICMATGLMFYDTASNALMPGLVRPSSLMAANAAIRLNLSVGWMAGPGIGGWLVAVLTAPFALIVDAVTYLWSAFFVSRMPEPPRKVEEQAKTSIWADIKEGGRTVSHHPVLRAVVGGTALLTLGNGIFVAVYILFLTRDLDQPAWAVALPYVAMGVSAVVGSLTVSRITKRFGLGPAMIGAGFLNVLATVAIPLTSVSAKWILLWVLLPWLISGFVTAIFSSAMSTVVQTSAPSRLLGRVSATMSVLSWSCMPLGSLIGGVLGVTIGLRATLFVSIAGYAAAPVLLLLSPARQAREATAEDDQPQPAEVGAE
ncbi:MFS transporter [Nonomuraea sp. K274]|uniref:MFS transporter n=1 Tax=Nonomuraea cypriaca TaxID=1187855 RepID=A0A931A8Q6_9ACTN|nr:MFS transporter [Nonomuraea cypriaca]MBF8187065.1 MFS transporter [Nonomuraea cypriaca]